MFAVVWVATVLLTLHSTNSYILLTANLDDVQAIAKQLVESSIVDQIKNIWRRASSQFSQYVDKNGVQNRANVEDIYNSVEEGNARENSVINGHGYLSDENRVERRSQVNEDAQELNKNASFYLSSIKKIMDGI